MAVDGNPRASCAGRHRNCRAGHRHPDRHHPPQAGNTPSASTARQCRRRPPHLHPRAHHCAGQPQSRGDLLAGRTAPARQKPERPAPARSSVHAISTVRGCRTRTRWRGGGIPHAHRHRRTALVLDQRHPPGPAAARGRRDLDAGGHDRAARDRRGLGHRPGALDGGDSALPRRGAGTKPGRHRRGAEPGPVRPFWRQHALRRAGGL